MTEEELKNIPASKFALVNENKKLRDKELVTKPIGFFKDAMYRFSRNKGSIFGAIVIGLLVLYAILAPIISPYSVSYNDGYFRYTLPKVFTHEKIDFLDGCTQKTLNENTFIYYYAMGVESGHNAIKRQEYKKNSDDTFTFRLDSYNKTGMVFMTGVTQDDYDKIQDYQDRTGRQVIYPITEESKRPTQSQDRGNANYWYETAVEGSRTVPANYTFKEDGTVEFNNIYLKYSNQSLAASKVIETKSMPAFVKATDAGAGSYYLNMSYDYSEFDENGNLVKESWIDEGYFALDRRLDEDFFYFSKDTENATKFQFDATNKALIFECNGHTDASKDGTYYLAFPYTTGIDITLRPYANIDDDLNNAEEENRFLPLCLINESDRSQVEAVELNKSYALGAIREVGSKISSCVSDLMVTGFSITPASSSAASIYFTEKDDGYRISKDKGKFSTDLVIAYENDEPVFTIGTVAETAVWKFDETNHAIYTDLQGFNDASKNGLYYLVNKISSETGAGNKITYNSSIGLAKIDDITNDQLVDFYKVCDTANNPVDSIAVNTEYRLRSYTDLTAKNCFVVDGNFKGDNYRSKMRVEGQDSYQYAYAIAKSGHSYEIRVNYYEYYCYYHSTILKDRISQPLFIFGTTSYGQDIFTCLASGARFSFLMAIIVAVVNMIVGAIYGALEGYYGGKVDLIMERIVEILSAVPFMIVITLLKYHMHGSSHVLILFIAFFLTGWIGMSGLVRMQFYRFKNQEYVLASRTLGARDWRIMFKHIFPNSLGTIVTSCVLIIPGMIFSETSLSYLGIINLNTGNMTSVGTLLANAQPYLVTYPHMILFPSLFISLLMLCFNLFGNGLRDAFNPSLRGTED